MPRCLWLEKCLLAKFTDVSLALIILNEQKYGPHDLDILSIATPQRSAVAYTV